jgi:hypothetical protein
MAAPRHRFVARICCLLSFNVLSLANETLRGQEWPEASQSAPSNFEVIEFGDVACECGDELCGCCSASCADGGYCWNGPCLTDRLTTRFISTAESMAARRR